MARPSTAETNDSEKRTDLIGLPPGGPTGGLGSALAAAPPDAHETRELWLPRVHTEAMNQRQHHPHHGEKHESQAGDRHHPRSFEDDVRNDVELDA